MAVPLTSIVIYTKKMPEMVDFYCRFFGFQPYQRDGDRIVELKSAEFSLLLHPAAKGQKEGQSMLKLVFDVEDVEAFRAEVGQGGLEFGPVHRADGYVFSNSRDPSGNPISVSSRAFSDNRPQT